MGGRKSDIVHLNVGGKLFTSSVSTLVSSSSYFESRLSEGWREEDITCEDPIFIDQDPKDFSVLLTYMRIGHIEASALTTPVLFLAIFLGMEKLLNAVKQEAIRSKFEETNLALFLAAQRAHLIQQSDVRKQYASLSFYNPDHVSFTENRLLIYDFVVNVEVLGENGAVEQIPDCVTFIDGLNALNKLGYARYEKDKLETTENYEGVKARLFFSKLISQDGENMEVNSKKQYIAPDSTILAENARNRYEYYPRQFCCMMIKKDVREPHAHEDLNTLEIDMGMESESRTIRIDQGLDHGGVGWGYVTKNVRSFARRDLVLKIEKYNWMESEGYIQREITLAEAYHKVVQCLTTFPDSVRTEIMIWSRPLKNSDFV